MPSCRNWDCRPGRRRARARWLRSRLGFWAGHHHGHGLAAAQRDRRGRHPDRDRITAEQALVQQLDRGALDEAELDQPALELRRRQAGGRRAGHVERQDTAAKAHSGGAQCYGGEDGHCECFLIALGRVTRQQGEDMASIVLAHGAWSAGWAWKKMRPLIRAAGHEFFSPSYTGLGERAHLARPDIDLATHVQDVLAVLEFEELSEVTLLGHSYGGMVATGVADKAADRIARVVYIDAF